jgi:hypothetical protein
VSDAPVAAKNAVVFHRFTGLNRHSLHNGFTVSFVLSPVIGLCCHRRPQETCKKLASQELDAGLEASGPHDFAVRKPAPFVGMRKLTSTASRTQRP